MTHAYDTADESLVDSFKRIHANGEETRVHILSCGERYVALAGDVDPREYEAVAGACIAYAPSEDAARERAVAWMEQHPRGIQPGSSGGGIGAKLWNGLKKLDQSTTPETDN